MNNSLIKHIANFINKFAQLPAVPVPNIFVKITSLGTILEECFRK